MFKSNLKDETFFSYLKLGGMQFLDDYDHIKLAKSENLSDQPNHVTVVITPLFRRMFE